MEQRSSDIGAAAFDKDDDLAVEFVAAASNLRSLAYGIPTQALFDAKVRLCSCSSHQLQSKVHAAAEQGAQLSVSEHGARRSSDTLQSMVHATAVNSCNCSVQRAGAVVNWSSAEFVAACPDLGLIFMI